MTWEWSHAPEAYDSARQNTYELDRGTLRIVWAEIKANDSDTPGFPNLDLEIYSAKLEESLQLSNEQLASDIWAFAETERSCTNGGWKAHLCPFGCEPHMVSFEHNEGE